MNFVCECACAHLRVFVCDCACVSTCALECFSVFYVSSCVLVPVTLGDFPYALRCVLSI